MNKQTARIMFVVVAAALFGLILTACGGRDTALTVPAGAQAGDLTLEPCKFKWNADEYEADCGTLIVPENRAKADSRLIALPVMRVRATGESITEPIFFLNGGPGGSNMGPKPPALGLANHDFVMAGYRGVDGSVVLDCPEVERARTGVGDDLLSPESRANFAGAWAQCAARLQAEGVDLDGYTIPEVVADLEAARVGLGYERVNLASLSYGTRIAQIYAYLHPDRIYRSGMISVNPPGHLVWEPETIDAQLEYYAQLCAQDAECSARTPDLAETMRNVAHNLPERWLFIPIDPGQVKVVTFVQLFNRGSAALVFDAYIAAEQGDPSGLALMSFLYDLLPSGNTWGEMAAKAFSADYDPSRDYAVEMDPPGSILGSPLSLLEWSTIASWPTQQLIPAELRRVQPSDVETLLVSGSVDFSTPAEFATDELLPYLTNGKQVILAEMGHVDDLGRLQPAAFERLATSFYDTGVADDSLFTYAPMDFGVSLGAPTIAKIVLGIVLLLMAIVGMIIWFIVRRIRRRMVSRRSQSAA
ncbi:MAG: alpha/beta fold hydrolase [Chloroflexi bacterium]|nr:alpha/beta fold hydrolase [Chloroflexota bacterium]